MYNAEEISLETFKAEVERAAIYCIDLSSLINTCGAFPIQIHYQADQIVVLTEYPERIVLKSGKSIISISQICRITRINSDGRSVYTISCGDIEELKTTIKIYQA